MSSGAGSSPSFEKIVFTWASTVFSVDPSALTESQLTVRPGADCPDQSTVTDGVYAISLTGSTLTFTADHDSCGDRKATLASSPWTRKP